MSTLTWKNPPNMGKRGRRPSEILDEVADKLKARPDRWALVVEGAKSAGSTRVWIKRGCQSTASLREDGAWDIYAMYPKDVR